MRNLGLVLAVLVWTPAIADAQIDNAVSIRVRGPNNRAVPSKIFIRKDGVAQPTIETDSNGERILPTLQCTNQVEVRVRPNSLYYTGSGQWRTCSGSPMVIAVSQNTITNSAAGALAYSYPPTISQRRDSLQSALEQGDSDVARQAAYDLAVFLRQSGRSDLSTAMAAVVVDQSTARLADAGVDVPEQPLVFDVQQGAYVSTPETLDALRQFQLSAGIRSAAETSRPQWNLRTVQALSANEP